MAGGALCHSQEVRIVETEAVKQLIEAGMPSASVEVTGDGRHFEAVVVSAEFEGLTPIQRHRMVLKTVEAQITSDELHALSIRTMTPDQAG